MSKAFIPGIIQFSYTENSGAAFGFLKNRTLLLTVMTSVLILCMLYIIVSKRFSSRLVNTALILITAGGIGNLYDRIVNGYVVDYLEFTFMNYAIFNFADALINIGAVLLFMSYFFVEKSGKEKRLSNEPGICDANEADAE